MSNSLLMGMRCRPSDSVASFRASTRTVRAVKARSTTAVKCVAAQKTGRSAFPPKANKNTTGRVKLYMAPGGKSFDPLDMEKSESRDAAAPLNVFSKRAPQVVEEEDTTIEDAFLLLLRVVVGSLMIHHGIDKVGNAEGFTKFVTAKYFGFLPNPLAWTYLAAYAQIIMPAGLIPGFATRATSLVLGGTMAFACVFHFLATGLEGFPLAVVKDHSYAYETSGIYLSVFLYFVAKGGGKFSIDSLFDIEQKVLDLLPFGDEE